MTDLRVLPAAKHQLFLTSFIRKIFLFPRWQDAMLALLSSVLLISAFPNFDLWFLAWFALVPMFIAVERNKMTTAKSFWLGLLMGSVFYFGSCWWLTYAPIRYGGLPAPLIFLLFVPVTVAAGFFTGLFAAILARLLSKFGHHAIFLTSFVWTACELARYWLTGNAWNAFGYSQAFRPDQIQLASYGGVFLVSFLLIISNSLIYTCLKKRVFHWSFYLSLLLFITLIVLPCFLEKRNFNNFKNSDETSAVVIALQPNVPMSGLTYDKYLALWQQHVELAQTALLKIENNQELKDLPRVVVFPESPMSFQYAQDAEFREFVENFNSRNRASLIFNGWEPTAFGDGLTNSAVMVNVRGEKVAQYDKIRLVPFGEYVPQWIPFSNLMPTVVGRSTPGKGIHLMPFGSRVRAGVMICYESAFGDISGQFVQNGADVLVELTNDGYSGDTPILRQHLANAVFRAVETNRPLLRVTNVGITAYINERGEISDATETYTTASRIWKVAKSDGEESFYVRHGDLFAWICVILTVIFLSLTFFSLRKINN